MKKRNKIIAAIAISLVVVIPFGSYIYTQSLLNRMTRTELPKSDEELGITSQTANTTTDSNKPEVNKQEEKKDNILNIVFFGLDRRNPDDNSRSDSIMVVSLDKKAEKVKVSSLMRDMYIPIPGKEDNRINAAYAYGGPLLAIKTINSNFGLNIRDYVTIDFFGLEDLIDKVGGVNIDIKANEVPLCSVSKPGLQRLTGKQALAYSRIRYVGNSDYERTERQRRVLNELFKKVKEQGTTKLPGMVTTLLPFVETSLSNNEILDLAIEATKFNTQNIEQFRLPVDGTFKSQTIRGMSVLVPNVEQNKLKINEFIYGSTSVVSN
jgi:LCP family protein required for cell wall assembly